MNKVFNCDNLEYMRTVPDKYFDLAIVDPPYGEPEELEEEFGTHFHYIGRSERYKRDKPAKLHLSGGGRKDRYKRTINDATGGGIPKNDNWDIAPPKEYFEELFRISKNQIIWGGNYFDLPPSRNFIIWKKLSISETFSMAMCEYAWTSIDGNAKVFEFAPQGKKSDPRFHPTQKPVELYKWLLRLYAKPGDKIFDSHIGSGSIRIACHDAGLDLIGCEIDTDYFNKQEKRYEDYIKQGSLFSPEIRQEQTLQGDLFK